MELIRQIFDLFLHLDTHLNEWSEMLGPWLYLILFLIVFCETGLVVTPFLPGDSLLFAVGALAANPDSPINVLLACVLLCLAANCGDTHTISFLGGTQRDRTNESGTDAAATVPARRQFPRGGQCSHDWDQAERG